MHPLKIKNPIHSIPQPWRTGLPGSKRIVMKRIRNLPYNPHGRLGAFHGFRLILCRMPVRNISVTY